MKTVLIITAVASLLVGCATSSVHQAEQWEYKVTASPLRGFNRANQEDSNPENRRKTSEAFLNDMGKQGWIFIEKDELGWHYFKRVKR